MKTAEELILAFTGAFRRETFNEVIELFADDAVFEMPYLSSVGIQSRYEGRREVREFLNYVLELYPDWEFKPEDVKVLISTPDQVFAEYISRPTAAATGRKIDHLFMGRLVAENGKIKLMREALNTVAAAQVLLPGGLAELPAVPEGTIRSY